MSAEFETIPTTLETVLDPEWLQWALDDVGDGERVVSVEAGDSSQTLAQKIRFQVVVESADGGRRSRDYCVKAHLDGSSSADLLSEARFYRDLAPRLDLRMPTPYYAAVDDAGLQAMIIMDDIAAQGGRFLNAFSPYSVETARDSLGQLAQLHGQTWGGARSADLDWLVPRVGSMADIYPLERLQSFLDDGRAADVAPELRDAANVVEALRITGKQEMTCVIHADTQSGNCYLDAAGRACWIDWQMAQRGSWAVDVSYHLATVLSVEDRRVHEADLVRHYLGELESLGVAVPSWEDAWDLYTLSFPYGYFLWTITRVSSREVVLLHLPRLAAALTDHDTYRRLGVV